MPVEYFTLPQLADAAGVRPKDIQRYRERGLLPDTMRRPSRQGDRAFTRAHLDRLRFIKRALAYGFSLDAIAQFVSYDRILTCNDVYGSRSPSWRGCGNAAAPRTLPSSPSKP
jgi:DNA-binding transcriptional MerR regulator